MDRIKRKDKMISLRSLGLSYGSIAKLFNCSRQRVHQIISGYKLKRNKETELLFERIKQRDDNQCQWGERCKGEEVWPGNLIIHHIDFNNENNNPSNLITLCKKCHLYFHSFNHVDKKIEKKLQTQKWREGIRKERIKIKCLNCGKIKKFYPYQAKIKFCDRKCHSEYQIKNWNKKAMKIYKLHRTGDSIQDLMKQFSMTKDGIYKAIQRAKKLSTS